jgi:hypothetical protein
MGPSRTPIPLGPNHLESKCLFLAVNLVLFRQRMKRFAWRLRRIVLADLVRPSIGQALANNAYYRFFGAH